MPENETQTGTETDIHNKYTELNGNLCCRLPLDSMNSYIHAILCKFFYYFLSVSVLYSVTMPLGMLY